MPLARHPGAVTLKGASAPDCPEPNMNFARQLLALAAVAIVRLAPAYAQDKELVVGSSATDRPFALENPPTIISELANGGVDAAIGDNGVIAFRVQEHKNLKTVDDPSFPKEYFGVVVKQGNKALLDKINTGLAGVKADGTYGQIYKKW